MQAAGDGLGGCLVQREISGEVGSGINARRPTDRSLVASSLLFRVAGGWPREANSSRSLSKLHLCLVWRGRSGFSGGSKEGRIGQDREEVKLE